MKTIFTVLLCVPLSATLAQVREIKTASSIKDVTVFLKGAQVTRNAIAEVPAGTSLVILSGTSPSIREESIQAESTDNVRILGVSFRINHMEEIKTSDQIVSLNRERDKLKSMIEQEQGTSAIYEQEAAMLNANRSIAGNQTGLNVAELKIAVSYYRERMQEITQLRRQCKANVDKWTGEANRFEAQLAELKAMKPMPKGEIVIKLNTKAPARTSLKVAYLVQEAAWFPQYDIRAKDVQSAIAITYKANVSQQSGEDWSGVNLTISSGNPSLTGARPIIQPWHLGFNNQLLHRDFDNLLQGKVAGVQISSEGEVRGRVLDEAGAPMPGVNVVIKGSTVGTVSDANGMFSIVRTNDASTLVFSFIGYATREVAIGGRQWMDVSLDMDVQQLSEVVVTGFSGSGFGSSYSTPVRVRRTIAATPVVRQTNVEFAVEEPFTILSNGEHETVEMVEYEVDALFEYYCAPKVDKDAFLTAKLTGWDEYNFLEGEASLFFEGKYLGKSVLDTRSVLDTLTISLGRDRNVLVKREKVKDVSSTQFMGANRKNVFAYEISIRNKKEQPIRIRVEDQFPVPNTKEISVDELESSGGSVNEESGLVTWDFTLPPGKSEKVELKYVVKYPRHAALILE
jgi:hypothetical protein